MILDKAINYKIMELVETNIQQDIGVIAEKYELKMTDRLDAFVSEIITYDLEAKYGFENKQDIFRGNNIAVAPSLGYLNVIKIGTQEISLGGFKTLQQVSDEIINAILEELAKVIAENYYLAELTSDGFYFLYKDMKCMDDVIRFISENRYCDNILIDKLKNLGYIIKKDDFYGWGEESYIELVDCMNGEKIWLVEVIKNHTLYQELKSRTCLEVIYILVCCKYKELVFASEL